MSIQLSLERQSIYTWFFLKERSNNGDFFDYHGQNLKKLQVRTKKHGFCIRPECQPLAIQDNPKTNQEILDFLKKRGSDLELNPRNEVF